MATESTVDTPQNITPHARKSRPGVERSIKLRLRKNTTTKEVRVEKTKFSAMSRNGEPYLAVDSTFASNTKASRKQGTGHHARRAKPCGVKDVPEG
jgi:hypothetical protein